MLTLCGRGNRSGAPERKPEGQIRWSTEKTKEGDAVSRQRSRLIRTCRDVGWHGGRRPRHRRRVQEVRAEHIQQEQVQQLLQAEGGAQRGGSGMQQGEFCLMDSYHLRLLCNPLPRPLFGSSSFATARLLLFLLSFFLPLLYLSSSHKYMNMYVVVVIERLD